MKKLALFLLIMALTVNAYSEEVFFRAKKGDQALLFRLMGLDNITAGNFNGGLGYQYYFSNHAAFRFGIGGNYSSETVAKPAGMENDSVFSQYGFSIMPAIRFNVASSRNILAYAGIEALASINKQTIDGVNFGSTKITDSYNTFGLGAILGAEWFPWSNVSISAEYSLMFKTSSGKEEITSGSNKQENKMPDKIEFGLGSSAANFTISFFFN